MHRIALISVLAALVAVADPEPVFRLTFENGLQPAAPAETTGQWLGKEPPRFADEGLFGKALVVGYDDDTRVRFAAPAGLDTGGTLLLWSRGIANWDLYKMHNTGGRSSLFFQGWGPHGWASISKWNYDTAGVKLMVGAGATADRQLFFPRFDPYRWTQLGLTWENGRVRLFLNGDLVREENGFPFGLNAFAVGGNAGEAGCRRLVDECTLYAQALSPSQMKRRYRQDLGRVTQPIVTAPHMAAPPAIDGTVAAGEWDSAAMVDGLLDRATGERDPDSTAFLVGYDDDWLYVAMRGQLTELARTRPEQVAMNGFLRNTRTKHDEDVDADDAMELLVSPGFWTAPEWTEYRLVANSAGIRYDYYRGPDGLKLAWNPNWQSASTVTPEGWICEVRVPLAAFGAAPEPGAAWALQFVRIWKQLKDQHDYWGWGSRLPDDTTRAVQMAGITHHKRSFPGTLRFGGDTAPIVRVTRIGALERRQVDWEATITNPGPIARRLTTTLRTDTDDIRVARHDELAAGETLTFKHVATLDNFGTAWVVFEVVTDDDGVVWHRTALPFYLAQTMSVRVRRYPSYERFQVELDLGAFAAVPLDELHVGAHLENAAGKVVWDYPAAPADGYQTAVPGTTDGLTVGDYTLVTRIRRGAELLTERRQPFAKKSLPPWHGNTSGRGPEVPTPFIPVTVDRGADSVAVWGRRYTWSGGLFPATILTQQEAVLAAPMHLVVRGADGQTTVFTKADTVEWTTTTAKRAAFTRRARRAGVQVAVDGWVEYDGFNWYTLRVEGTAAVQSVVLEMPCTAACSTLMNVYDYSLAESGRVPPAGYATSMRPFWLGNADVGVQWLAEHTADWQCDHPKQALQVRVDGDGQATLAIHFVDRATDLATTPLVLPFGLNATPVRPSYPGYRLLNRNDHPVVFTGGAWAYTQRFNPASLQRWRFWTEMDDTRRAARDTSARHASGGVYYTSSAMYPDNEDYAYWGDEWSNNPNFVWVKDPTITNPAQRGDVGVCQASPSWQDFTVWHYAKLFEETPCRGVYADDGPGFCSNPHHGHEQPKVAILGYREIIRRVYEVLRAKYPDQTYNILHQSGMRNTAYLAFYDVYATGENFSSKLTMGQPHYADSLRVDAFLSEARGQHWGPTCWFLPELQNVRGPFVEQYGKETEQWYPHWAAFVNDSAEYLIGLIMLHDSTLWPAWIPNEPVQRLRQALRDIGLDNEFDFVGYWEQKAAATPPGTYASWYVDRASGRSVVVFLNATTDAGPVTLAPDWPGLGLDPATTTVRNAAHEYLPGNGAAIDNGKLTFTSGARNYRLLLLRRE